MSHFLESWLPSARFAVPDWLWGVPVTLTLALLLWFWIGYEFRRRLGLLVASHLRTPLIKGGVLIRKRLRLILLGLALAALCTTLARPLAGTKDTAASRTGVNLLIALDGSRSMLAEDVGGVAKNRFVLAQAGIKSLLGSLGSDRTGLLLFAGEPTLVSPLTFDTISLQLIAEGLSVELAGKGGSSMQAVIERASTFFQKKPYASKVLILFTDGEETVGDAVVAAQGALQKQGIRIFTIGVGSTQGAVIPKFVRNVNRDLIRIGTVHDEEGKEVHSKLEEDVLQTLASVGGGRYVNLTDLNGDLSQFYRQSVHPLAAPMEEISLQDLKEQFHLPLLIAFCLILMEMLLQRIKSGQVRRTALTPAQRMTGRGKAAATLCVVFMALLAAGSLVRANIPEAQQLLEQGSYEQAFKRLQKDLLASPDDPLTRYNYAVGAYAAKKYSVAIESFQKLITAAEPEVAARSQMQLGNNHYRLGEQLQKSDPDATVVQWEKALASYSNVTGLEAAVHNQAKVQKDLLALLRKLASRKEVVGDEAARVTADQGVAAWREALTYLDKALKLPLDEVPAKQVQNLRKRVSGKIYQAYFNQAEDKRRRAEYQQYSAPELAIEQLESAITDYDEALTARPDDRPALSGKQAAIKALEPLLIQFAERQYEEGRQLGSTFVEDAIALWKQAGVTYDKVLQNNPASQPAQRGKEKTNRALHDGYVNLGDQKQKRAGEGQREQKEKDALLEEALDHYQTALNLQPGNAATKDKLMRLGAKLTHRFVERGKGELSQGRILAKPKPPEAIAWLERSVQSFTKALRFEQQNGEAATGKKEAEDLLRQLRDLDAENQRRILARNKKLDNARDMENPGKLALKLLDYDTDKLASKRQQNYTAPEDRSVKDW